MRQGVLRCFIGQARRPVSTRGYTAGTERCQERPRSEFESRRPDEKPRCRGFSFPRHASSGRFCVTSAAVADEQHDCDDDGRADDDGDRRDGAHLPHHHLLLETDEGEAAASSDVSSFPAALALNLPLLGSLTEGDVALLAARACR
jgi:hypothetical protein